MHINGIDHMTIIVKNLEESKKFYVGLLGFTQLPAVNEGDHILHYFLVPGGQKIELNEYLYQTRDSVSLLKDRGTWRHLAFAVDDAKAWEQKLTQAGYPFHYPVSFDKALGCYSGLVKDPNGVELEFVQHVGQ